ncbi:carbamoyltransferase HypF [Azonexus sp. R2A61]|uniref:carbamoyltransferase HypF n=1 Tax=Azonexus sp. R2A61 TaxID=2744443 RepID=UPI001F37A940|nr:carbamoyltransferase HypF [Azonexus sp. R2A61]
MHGVRLRVRGLVQGVGFRPYVWRLAGELGLAGWVRNDGGGVTIAVDGPNTPEFLRRLPLEKPPLARIDSIERQPCAVDAASFDILDSVDGDIATTIGPDAAICPDCIAELCDPADRRWRHPFITCTHCGPRFTVSAGIPYDRARTSLAAFPLCPDCAGEYASPADRRFHAETTCCPACGPTLRLLDENGRELAVDRGQRQKIAGDGTDPIAATLALLQAGRIVAIKGLGGFHLACDARNAAAVARLRQRKQREAKPFAVMGLNAASFAGLAQLGAAEQALLDTPAAPIVLCRKGDTELPGVAPGLAWLGTMRPATPLHLLLWHEAAGRPVGTAWLADAQPLLLVMTSANPHGEPLVADDADARQRLSGIADAFLTHDRAIVVRCDDSVLRPGGRSTAWPAGEAGAVVRQPDPAGEAAVDPAQRRKMGNQTAAPAAAAAAAVDAADGPCFIRRARGYVPLPIPLAKGGPTVLALGGYLKNTVCVLRGREAFLSQHVGGLDNAAAIRFQEETVAHLLAILDVRPDLIAHDRHPDFPSTQLALRLAAEWQVPALAVGHHHAHLAAICAEHALKTPLIGLALDGVGLGDDDGAWGGELLRLDGAACVRLGHLQELPLPGGDRAAREPWRMAIAALHAAGEGHRIGGWLARTWPAREAGPLLTLLARRLRCPPTSSLGRWFDAAAGVLGVCDVAAYEGDAAMRLESLALAHGPVAPLAGGWRLSGDGTQLELTPLIAALLDVDDAAAGAALFHATLADGLAKWLKLAVDRSDVREIAVAGGCAMNAVLMAALRDALAGAGLTLREARQAPPNDGGLALGQAWVARRYFKETKHVSGNSGAGG